MSAAQGFIVVILEHAPRAGILGKRYAVYDPVLSAWPIIHISLHRLRMDLQYPQSFFSHCPSRRGGKSERTIHGSPLLRVFNQNSEAVAIDFPEREEWLSGPRNLVSPDFRRMLVRHWFYHAMSPGILELSFVSNANVIHAFPRVKAHKFSKRMRPRFCL